MNRKLIIGTRASRLALVQAELVQLKLHGLGYATDIKKISTKGDEILDRSLMEIGGKGLFLKEIEEELLAGRIDLAVHSMKDVPFELPDKLVIAAVLAREDPGDAFLSLNKIPIGDLPDGAMIGTSSLRRLMQVQKKYPHLIFKTLRGSVESRIRKMEASEFDGIILAMAGLKRLGLESKVTEVLDIVPAVAQGAIGVECRGNDLSVMEILSELGDESTARQVNLEREFLKKTGGDCKTPVGCHVSHDESDPKRFIMDYFFARPDGRDFQTGELTGTWREGENLVRSLKLNV